MDESEVMYWDSYQNDYSPSAYDSYSNNPYGCDRDYSPAFSISGDDALNKLNSVYSAANLSRLATHPATTAQESSLQSYTARNDYLAQHTCLDCQNSMHNYSYNTKSNKNMLPVGAGGRDMAACTNGSSTCVLRQHSSQLFDYPPDSMFTSVSENTFSVSNNNQGSNFINGLANKPAHTFLSKDTQIEPTQNQNKSSFNSFESLNNKFKSFLVQSDPQSQPQEPDTYLIPNTVDPRHHQSQNPSQGPIEIVPPKSTNANKTHNLPNSLHTIVTQRLITPPVPDKALASSMSSPVDPFALQARLSFLKESIEEHNRLSNPPI